MSKKTKKVNEVKLYENMKFFHQKKMELEAAQRAMENAKAFIINELTEAGVESVRINDMSANLSTYTRESVSLTELREALTPKAFKTYVQPAVTESECNRLTVKAIADELAEAV